MNEMLGVSIERTKIDDFNFVVYPSSFYNPIARINSLETSLESNRCEKGKILVDLLLCNGNENNRFVELYFDGKKIDRDSIRTVAIERNYERLVNQYYKNNKRTIMNGVVLPSQYMKYVR